MYLKALVICDMFERMSLRAVQLALVDAQNRIAVVALLRSGRHTGEAQHGGHKQGQEEGHAHREDGHGGGTAGKQQQQTRRMTSRGSRAIRSVLEPHTGFNEEKRRMSEKKSDIVLLHVASSVVRPRRVGWHAPFSVSSPDTIILHKSLSITTL